MNRLVTRRHEQTLWSDFSSKNVYTTDAFDIFGRPEGLFSDLAEKTFHETEIPRNDRTRQQRVVVKTLTARVHSSENRRTFPATDAICRMRFSADDKLQRGGGKGCTPYMPPFERRPNEYVPSACKLSAGASGR